MHPITHTHTHTHNVYKIQLTCGAPVESISGLGRDGRSGVNEYMLESSVVIPLPLAEEGGVVKRECSR